MEDLQRLRDIRIMSCLSAPLEDHRKTKKSQIGKEIEQLTKWLRERLPIARPATTDIKKPFGYVYQNH
jgi:hypothetical protein